MARTILLCSQEAASVLPLPFRADNNNTNTFENNPIGIAECISFIDSIPRDEKERFIVNFVSDHSISIDSEAQSNGLLALLFSIQRWGHLKEFQFNWIQFSESENDGNSSWKEFFPFINFVSGSKSKEDEEDHFGIWDIYNFISLPQIGKVYRKNISQFMHSTCVFI